MNTAAVTTRDAALREPALAAAYASCAEIARARARNFYYGLRLTPEPRRSAVYSIYAWMRRGDDAVDDAGSPEQRRAALAEFAQATRRVLAGDLSGLAEPFWAAFAATMADYPIRRAWIDEMILGLGEDLEPRRLATMEELERYCYRVASTVGLVCVAIWGLRAGLSAAERESVESLAVRRGQAFQLTNILRDFAQDFDDSPPRVYLPEELLSRHGVSAGDIRAWRDPARCRGVVTAAANLAREHYEASARLDELIAPACRPTLWAMTRIYRGILDRIAARPEAIVSGGRVRLSGLQKTTIALRAWAGAKWGARR